MNRIALVLGLSLSLSLGLVTSAVGAVAPGSGGGDAVLLEQLVRARQISAPEARERALHEALRRVDARAPMSAALRAQLESLEDYPSSVRVPANPEHRQLLTREAYPVAATARALLATARHAEAARRWLAESRRTGNYDPSGQAPDALVLALEQAGDAEIAGLAAAGAPSYPDAARAVIAARSGSAAFHRDWLASAVAAPAVAAVVQIPRRFSGATAFELLESIAARNPALASAAILQMPVVDDGRVADALLALLDDPRRGASAAQALAHLPAERWVDRLAAADSDSGWKHRLLALRWSGSPPALARLRRWQREGRIPDRYAASVSAWTR